MQISELNKSEVEKLLRNFGNMVHERVTLALPDAVVLYQLRKDPATDEFNYLRLQVRKPNNVLAYEQVDRIFPVEFVLGAQIPVEALVNRVSVFLVAAFTTPSNKVIGVIQ